MDNLRLPEEINISGSVLTSKDRSAAEYAAIRRDARVVTLKVMVSDSEEIPVGSIVPVFFGLEMVREFELDFVLFEGNLVQLQLEQRRAGITGYINPDGDFEAHTEDSLSPRNAFNMDIPTMLGIGMSFEVCKYFDQLRAENAKKDNEAARRVAKFHGFKTPLDPKDELASLRAKLPKAVGMVKMQIDARIKTLEEARNSSPAKATETAEDKGDDTI